MAFKKIMAGQREVKGMFLTISANGTVALSSEASRSLTSYDFDVYEDEEAMKLKFQANQEGEVKFRKLNQKYNHRYIFTRSFLSNYLLKKYGFDGSVKLNGEKVEDGYIFDISSAIEVHGNRAMRK